MLGIFITLIILCSLILGLIVLIQNPKGGGLSGTFGGFGNQIMGVKQTNDALEKGTWIFAAAIAVLSILSPLFIPGSAGNSGNDLLNKMPTRGINQQPTAPAQSPATTVPMPSGNATQPAPQQ